MPYHLRMRETSGLVPGQSRLRGRSRRHPSLATDAQAWARAVWTPCLPQPRPAIFSDGLQNRRISASAGRPFRSRTSGYARLDHSSLRPRTARFSDPSPSVDGADFLNCAVFFRRRYARRFRSKNLDRDHAAQGADRGERRGEERVGRLMAQDGEPDQDAEGDEAEPVGPAEDHRLLIESRGEPEEAQCGEDRELEPARPLHPRPEPAGNRLSELASGLRGCDLLGRA